MKSAEKKALIRKMVILSIILFLIGWNTNCFGQDSIYQKGSAVIFSKVTEVSSSEIKYRKANNPDGPVYTLDRNEVSRIKYQNEKATSF